MVYTSTHKCTHVHIIMHITHMAEKEDTVRNYKVCHIPHYRNSSLPICNSYLHGTNGPKAV